MTGIMTTHSGQRVNLIAPDPDTILIEDIAHALANICRFGGHTRRHYSVASHSLLVMELVEPKHKLQALLHDAPEAFCGDVVTPLKNLMPEFQRIEDMLWGVIARKFGVPVELSSAVLAADRRALDMERTELFKPLQCGTAYFAPPKKHASAFEFLRQFNLLKNPWRP
jgi:5'-deoxynucleotidase YfbR-like HD superfamily hydrolase